MDAAALDEPGVQALQHPQILRRHAAAHANRLVALPMAAIQLRDSVAAGVWLHPGGAAISLAGAEGDRWAVRKLSRVAVPVFPGPLDRQRAETRQAAAESVRR